MVSRVYVEKKPGFDVEARQLERELKDVLNVQGLEGLRLINRYDVEGIDEGLFERCIPTVFSEPQSDTAHSLNEAASLAWPVCPAIPPPPQPAKASVSTPAAARSFVRY